MAKDKEVKVSQCLKEDRSSRTWTWEWNREKRNEQEQQQHLELERILADCKTENKEDTWRWRTRRSEEISVALLRDEISKNSLDERDTPWKHWNKWVPPKVKLFIWRAIKRGIVVKVELARRGIQLEDRLCARCKSEEESVDHLLINCLKTRAVWWSIMIWLKLPILENITSSEEIFDKIEAYSGSKEWKKLIKAIAMTTLWQIWKSRNDVEFNRKEGMVTNLVDEVKELSFLWIKERSKLKTLVWERWKDFNIRDVTK
ncbi:uncharacterized protein LOC110887593 [Helianthus annuus]|uniref:uncharacterized protein LOC110887593 n=1 Tax=Helianthus annuus TaxID=4232 RepID=UPI000B8F37A0|nr:uncharacterized protein LOC110887593 [Helianthus annuus]